MTKSSMLVPEMIRYYLNEDQILPMSLPTCAGNSSSRIMFWRISTSLWSRQPTNLGYGMLVGPHASEEQRQNLLSVQANPRNYIADPLLVSGSYSNR